MNSYRYYLYMVCKLLLPAPVAVVWHYACFRRRVRCLSFDGGETCHATRHDVPGLLVAWSIFLLPVREPENA